MQSSTRGRKTTDTDQHASLETHNVMSSVAPTMGGFKVAVLGAAGGIGQPLCLLLKQYVLHPVLSYEHARDVHLFYLQRMLKYDW